MRIEFTVLGKPRAKGRPKFARRDKFVIAYTPKETEQAEYDFKMQSLQHRPEQPIQKDIPIMIQIAIFRPIPTSFSKKKQVAAGLGLIRPTTKPDFDNYGKLVCDAMQGIFYENDSQIVSCLVNKYYAALPRIEVRLDW